LPPIAERRAALTPYVNKEIMMGIRPESIHDDPLFLQEHPDWTIDVQVDVVEPMGSEIYVYFSLNGSNVVARLDVNSEARVLQRHKLAFDMSMVRFFDKESQQVIHRPEHQSVAGLLSNDQKGSSCTGNS
jgi:multiple sugar transport system ATP-binding protein